MHMMSDQMSELMHRRDTFPLLNASFKQQVQSKKKKKKKTKVTSKLKIKKLKPASPQQQHAAHTSTHQYSYSYNITHDDKWDFPPEWLLLNT